MKNDLTLVQCHLLSLLVMGLANAAQAQDKLPLKPTLTLAAAQQIAAAGAEYATAHQAPGAAIAIVDETGLTIYLERRDGTFPMSSEISIGKARTAALFRKPTKNFEDAIREGRTALVAVDEMTPLQGGVPLIVNGSVVGAVGVSGAANADQDSAIAEAAAKAAARLYNGTP